MRMQSAYSVTNIHGNKEIVETNQTIEYLTQEDIDLITTTYLNRNNHGIADLSRILRETEVHDSIRAHRSKGKECMLERVLREM